MQKPVIDIPQRPPWFAWGALSFTLGGVGAAFAVASCCALPMLLAGVGLGGAWLFGIARFAAPHRLAFLVMAAVLLVAGTPQPDLGYIWATPMKGRYAYLSRAESLLEIYTPAAFGLFLVGAFWLERIRSRKR